MEFYSKLLKTVTLFSGILMVIAVISGLPFMILNYSFSVQLIVWILLIIVAIFYITPNAIILKNKMIIIFFLFGSSIFVGFTLYETIDQLVNEKYSIPTAIFHIILSTSGITSLLIDYTIQSKSLNGIGS